MEHKSYDIFQDYGVLDIINIIDAGVQHLAKEHWIGDTCPPKFSVSLNNEDINNQSIMLTVDHLGYKFTWKLFPKDEAMYGYGSVLDQMTSMYNRTM